MTTRDMLPDTVSAIDFGLCLDAIKSGDVKLADYRAMYKSKLKRDTKLTDEQLTALITAVTVECDKPTWLRLMQQCEQRPITVEADVVTDDDDDTADETSDRSADDDTGKPVAKPVSETDAKAMLANATNMARKIGDATEQHIASVIAAKETILSASIFICAGFRKDFTSAELAAMPFPGTSTDENPYTTGADKFSYVGNVDGKMRTKRTSWWRETVRRTTLGAEYQSELDKAKDLLREKKVSKVDGEAAVNLWTGRLNAAIAAYSKAYKLWHQWELMNGYKTCLVSYIYDKDAAGKPTKDIRNTPTPIMIQDKDSPADLVVVSVTTFCSYDTVKARAAGGTFTALLETLKAGTPGDDAAIKPVTIKVDSPVEDFLSVCNIVNHWFKTAKHKAELVKSMTNDVTALDAFGDMMMEGDDCWTKIEPLYRPRLIAREQAKEKEAAERIAEQTAKLAKSG